jgi:glycosyltransferase involved in cell wall biosynthesis
MPQAEVKPHRIKVAVVIPTHWDHRVGGSQYQAKLLIEQLYQSYGASISYFTARAGSNRHFADHQVICVGHRNAPRRYGHFWDYFRLQKALRDFAPDVIYQRVGCAYTGISARYANRAGTPMIWHLASAGDCRKPPAIGKVLGRPHVLIETRLAKQGVARADMVIAQSQDQIKILQANFGRQADRLIRNFHPVPPAVEKQAGRFTVLWIGNFKRIKRPELFVEIASLLKQKSEIELIMVGRAYPSQSMQDGFEQMMASNKNVKHVGAMSQEEVNKLLDRSHLLVNTSESEGFSNTFVQAWMRSVPVLTLGVNPDDLLGDSFLGYSCESTAEIADAIRGLASDFDMLEDMGKKSRQYAIEQFSMKNAAELADLIIRTATGNRDTAVEKSED